LGKALEESRGNENRREGQMWELINRERRKWKRINKDIRMEE